MLFALSAAGVPSHAHMIRLGEAAIAAARPRSFAAPAAAPPPPRQATRVVIGLTSRCPYGLAACWGGAYQSLLKLSGAAYVNPVADARTSTAEVFLHDKTSSGSRAVEAGIPGIRRMPATRSAASKSPSKASCRERETASV